MKLVQLNRTTPARVALATTIFKVIIYKSRLLNKLCTSALNVCKRRQTLISQVYEERNSVCNIILLSSWSQDRILKTLEAFTDNVIHIICELASELEVKKSELNIVFWLIFYEEILKGVISLDLHMLYILNVFLWGF